MTALLTAHRVSLRFGGVQALDGIDLEVHHEEIFSVIGPNGAGKTSFLNVLSGHYRPTGGRVELDGFDVTGWSPARLARQGVARTFQNLSLFDALTVEENLLVGAHRLGTGGVLRDLLPAFGRVRRAEREVRRRVAELIERFDLSEVAGEPAGRLPYGFQKRIDLARALALQPRLLLLDEPLAGMAAAERQAMGRLVLEAWRQGGLTVLLVEHDAAFVADVADRIAVFDFGRPLAEGDPDQVLRDPQVAEAYLGGGAPGGSGTGTGSRTP